ncbi:MAG: DUF6492 family protein [Pseudomonadota bacterium]
MAHRYALAWLPRATATQGEPVSVLVPLAEKDLPTLPVCLASLRANLMHEIRAVHVVGQRSARIEAVCREAGVNYTPEDEVLPGSLVDVAYVAGGRNRGGWLRQQLLKLSWPAFIDAERVVAVDSDTRLLRPLAFQTADGRDVLFTADEYEAGYARATDRLLGPGRRCSWSFVAHTMLFDRVVMTALQSHIAARAGTPWLDAIIAAVDRTIGAGLSEFDLYGTYRWRSHPDRVVTRYWYNRKVDLTTLRTPRVRSPLRRFNFLSCHAKP